MTPPPENLRPEARFWTVAIGTILIIVLSVSVATAAVGYGLMVHYVQQTQQHVDVLQQEQKAQQVQQAKPLCLSIKKINAVLLQQKSDPVAREISVAWNQFYVASKCPEILNGTYHA